jgi:hypothetical protein
MGVSSRSKKNSVVAAVGFVNVPTAMDGTWSLMRPPTSEKEDLYTGLERTEVNRLG